MEDNNVMCILSIAHFYSIPKLSQLINLYFESTLASNNDPTLLFKLLQECYEFNLNDELHSLVKYVAKFIHFPSLSDQIDVGVFSEALALINATPAEKIMYMKQFLGNYQLSDEEKQMIQKYIQADQKTYAEMVKSASKWLP